MATTDYCFLDIQLSNVNFNSLIMQFSRTVFFGKSLVFSDCSYLKLIFSKGFHETLFCVNRLSTREVMMIQGQKSRFTDFQIC